MRRKTKCLLMKCLTTEGLGMICCGLGLTMAIAAHAQQPPPADDLGGLLEGLDLEAAPEAPAPSQPAAPSQSPAGPEVAGEQSADQNTDQRTRSPGDAPLIEAYRSMQRANALLAQGETGEPTRAAQKRVVDLLDQMIRAAEQQSSAGEPGAPQSNAQQPTQPRSGAGESDGQPQGSAGEQEAAGESGSEDPGAEAQQGSGAGGEGEPTGQSSAAAVTAAGNAPGATASGQAAVWGHLPERIRGMLRSEMPTEYLPQYQDEISEYFRVLAEMDPDE